MLFEILVCISILTHPSTYQISNFSDGKWINDAWLWIDLMYVFFFYQKASAAAVLSSVANEAGKLKFLLNWLLHLQYESSFTNILC